MTRGRKEPPFSRANGGVKELKMSSCLFGESAAGICLQPFTTITTAAAAAAASAAPPFAHAPVCPHPCVCVCVFHIPNLSANEG